MPRPQAKGLTITVRIDGADAVLRAFRELPKQATAELRDAAGFIADDFVGWLQNAARNDSAQSALVAGTVKRVRDRVPAVKIGGSKRVGTGTGKFKGTASDILFGANFGARSHPQFRPWAGVGQDYFVFKTADEHASEIGERWSEAADHIIAAWERTS